MTPPKKNNIPGDKLERYDKLVRTNPKIERRGAANPYTSLNGHMFTYLSPSGSLALRLPQDEREKFLKKYKTTLFEAYGAVMKEYVTVPDSLLKNTKVLQPYFQMSYEYIKTLKAKPTKKKSRSAGIPGGDWAQPPHLGKTNRSVPLRRHLLPCH
jgi:TfoX/Sxy family transcriptional regulator of competence genes